MAQQHIDADEDIQEWAQTFTAQLKMKRRHAEMKEQKAESDARFRQLQAEKDAKIILLSIACINPDNVEDVCCHGRHTNRNPQFKSEFGV